MHRFYAPALDPARPIVTLPEEEARHLARVLRLAPGAVVAAFDGRGREFVARVESVTRGRVSLQILGPREAAPEPAVAMTLAQTVLKGDKMENVVRDAVMLGAADIQPLVSARAEASEAVDRSARRTERWQRIAIASAKQCGRAVVPRVHDVVTLDTLLARHWPATTLNLALVEPSQPHGRSLDLLETGSRPAAAMLLVGPEGGWTLDELGHLEARGFQLVTLGARTFRADAVTVAALAILQFIWGDL
jgi:16S rRNA (uracil1498-N3)-methyltransferase